MTSLLSDQENQIGTMTNDNDVIEEPKLTEAMPKIIQSGKISSPAVPSEMNEIGIDASVVTELALKLANSVPNLTTPWAAQQLCLPMQLIDEVFWQLKDDKLVEILGQQGPFSYKYAITQRGREHAQRLLEISGYVGPAPVSLETYTAMLKWQIDQRDLVKQEDVRKSIKDLVLPKHAIQVAELAVSSGRSLFLFGPGRQRKNESGLDAA